METDDFEAGLARFIARLCREDGFEAVIEPDTPLFANRLLTSQRMVDLLAWMEQAHGITVPDEQLSGEYFRDVHTIAQTFGPVAAAPARRP